MEQICELMARWTRQVRPPEKYHWPLTGDMNYHDYDAEKVPLPIRSSRWVFPWMARGSVTANGQLLRTQL